MMVVADASVTSIPWRPRVLWSPAEIFEGGTQGAWYDPSDLSTLFQDNGGTVPVTADGDPVALMLDLSGNGNDATQLTAAARPTWRTDGVLSWLEYDGVDDLMEIPAIAYAEPLSLCLGLQRFSSGDYGSFRSPLSTGKYAGLSKSGSGGAGAINNAGGSARLNGIPFAGNREALYNALQSASIGNSDAALSNPGTFFCYANLCPPGKVYCYLEAEGIGIAQIAWAERWTAAKSGVTL